MIPRLVLRITELRIAPFILIHCSELCSVERWKVYFGDGLDYLIVFLVDAFVYNDLPIPFDHALIFDSFFYVFFSFFMSVHRN